MTKLKYERPEMEITSFDICTTIMTDDENDGDIIVEVAPALSNTDFEGDNDLPFGF